MKANNKTNEFKKLDIAEPIQNALYATGKFTTEQCD